jgi:tRNA(Ile)-lysidine synthetase-like protein
MPRKLDKLVTGHTLDDQAETVLMRMIRGAGLRGLGGIHPRMLVDDEEGETCGEIVRPLLSFRRRELEEYLKGVGQTWREDATNSDTSFTRNRVRRLLIPLLEKEFNPAVAENLAELAEIARGEEDFWENELAGWMGTGVNWSEPEWARESRGAGLIQITSVESPTLAPGNIAEKTPTSAAKNAAEMGHPHTHPHTAMPEDVKIPTLSHKERGTRVGHPATASVDRVWLLSEPIAVQRRVVKAIGEQAGIPFEFKHVEEVLRFAAEEAGGEKEISLPLGWKVERHPEELLFVTPDLREPSADRDYEYELPVPGRVDVIEAGSTIEAVRVPADADAGYNPEQLLDAGSLPGTLRVRNWRAGDRFWPRHTKSPKKIKELLQELHVEQARRRSWPVVVSGAEIVWMRGFPPPAQFAVKPGREAIVIRETPTAGNAQHPRK